MNKKYQEILKNAGIRPSIQRMAIYSWLCENPIHPDVETVYNALYSIYPSLSKTTVYNTLKLFEEQNIIRSIKIEDDKLRFDAEMKNHLHFKCNGCNNIFDIFTGSKSDAELAEENLPSGFQMQRIQTNLWGLCPQCANK